MSLELAHSAPMSLLMSSPCWEILSVFSSNSSIVKFQLKVHPLPKFLYFLLEKMIVLHCFSVSMVSHL